MSKLLQQLQLLAASSPDTRAVIGSDIELEWKTLYPAVMSLASELNSFSSLGIHLHNSPSWVVSDLATIQAGVRNIPLPTFFSKEQLQHALTDARIEAVITYDPDLLSAITPVRKFTDIVIAGRQLTLLELEHSLGKLSRSDKITYTSGTTGTPILKPWHSHWLRHLKLPGKTAHWHCYPCRHCWRILVLSMCQCWPALKSLCLTLLKRVCWAQVTLMYRHSAQCSINTSQQQ